MLKGVGIYFAVASVITLLLYATDKLRARTGAWRVPERTLLFASLIGGAAGGTVGMLAFRHKTRKARFVAVNLVGLVWQTAAMVLLYFAGL